jgi:hypothetical protein
LFVNWQVGDPAGSLGEDQLLCMSVDTWNQSEKREAKSGRKVAV